MLGSLSLVVYINCTYLLSNQNRQLLDCLSHEGISCTSRDLKFSTDDIGNVDIHGLLQFFNIKNMIVHLTTEFALLYVDFSFYYSISCNLAFINYLVLMLTQPEDFTKPFHLFTLPSISSLVQRSAEIRTQQS